MSNGKMNLKDFASHLDWIRTSTRLEVSETPAQRAATIKRLKEDFEFFVQFMFPEYAKSKSAWFHIYTANLIKKNDVIRFIAEWFRGSSKSTVVDLMIVLWLWINDETKYCLLVGNSLDAAKELLADIQANFMANEKLIHYFGDQVRSGDWEKGYFKTKNGSTFRALGIGQNPRGKRNKGYRPDLIIVDDVESQELSNNPKRVRKLLDWINDDLMGTFDVGKQRFIQVNNRPFVNTVLGEQIKEKLKGAKVVPIKKLNPQATAKGAFMYQQKDWWHHLKVNAVDNDNNPSWPEKYTKLYWILLRADKSTRSFEREYMNNPVTEGVVFRMEWIQWIKMLPLHTYDYVVIYCDPSAKDGGDFKGIVLTSKIKTEIHLHKMFLKRCSRNVMVQKLYDFFEYCRDRKVYPMVYIEGGFAQDELYKDALFDEGYKRGYQLPYIVDDSKKQNKFARIEGMSPLYELGHVFYNIDEQASDDMILCNEQLIAIEEGSNVNDDGPDCIQGAISKLQERGRAHNTKPSVGKKKGSRAY